MNALGARADELPAWVANALVGVGTGVLAAMGLYVANHAALAPVPGWVALAVIAAAGVYAHALSRSLRESAGALFVGVATATVAEAAAYVAPLYLLPYASGARSVLAPGYVGRAVTGTFLELAVLYVSAFMLAVVADVALGG